ncbi:dTDP-4-dehydrorhamnose 3,5-epimerase [Herbaspirillum sp. SJZ099]|nr:dTDP-4-dehydrorhamnose 3,5-epimerase [Herbaspirillum sp. SJZ099]
MHLQRAPYEQTKLIRIINGRIIDFIVKPDGNNIIHWREIDASTDWVKIGPEFAHGFYALEDTIFEYICHGAYNEQAEQAFSILDFLTNHLGIHAPLLSEKDHAATPLAVTPSVEKS